METGYTGTTRAETAGLVEIGKIPKMFYTPAYGSPDVLFCSLLRSAREAYEATSSGILARDGQQRDPGYLAETYMAGLLLRDENFVPARVMRNYAHHYKLDFASGAIQLRTELYAVQQRATSLFSVRLEGLILGNQFVVRDAVTGKVLVQASEGQIQKPAFFTQELPLAAYQARRAPQPAAQGSLAELVDEIVDMQLNVSLPGECRQVHVLKSRGDLQAQVQDPDTGLTLCHLPLDCLNNLKSLMERLQKVLPVALAAGR